MEVPLRRLIILGSCFLSTFAQEVSIQVERSTSIRFQSENRRNYRLLATEDPSANTWSTLKDGIAGTGGEVTIFYQSERDQKLFFKVEISDGPPGQRSLLSLAGLDLSGKDLTGYNLEGNDLRGFKFFNVTGDNLDLAGADLRGAKFEGATLKNSDLRGVIMDSNTSLGLANLSGANLAGVVLGGARLDYSDLRGANLAGVRYEGSVLSGVNLAGQNLSNVVLRGVPLDRTDLTGCNLSGADLSRTTLQNAKLGGTTLTGANLEGTWLDGVSLAGRDLRGINFRGVNLGVGDLTGANLSGDDFSLCVISVMNPGQPALISGANLSGCNLTGMTFDSQNLPGLILQMSQVNFRNANLTGASFRDCNVQGCDFTGANLSFADFSGANLSGSTGFDADQPGMKFGPRSGPFPPGPGLPPDPTRIGTVLPDGVTTRNGTNPGTPLAPGGLQRLVLKIDDGATHSTVELSFSGSEFTVGQNTTAAGQFEYAARPVTATLHLNYPSGAQWYLLHFTSANQGQLYQSANGAAWLIGTFQIP